MDTVTSVILSIVVVVGHLSVLSVVPIVARSRHRCGGETTLATIYAMPVVSHSYFCCPMSYLGSPPSKRNGISRVSRTDYRVMGVYLLSDTIFRVFPLLSLITLDIRRSILQVARNTSSQLSQKNRHQAAQTCASSFEYSCFIHPDAHICPPTTAHNRHASCFHNNVR